MQLQWWQLARRAVIAGVIPGQNTVDSCSHGGHSLVGTV